jgi:multicomponent Na+:H+ antiporter subunit E
VLLLIFWIILNARATTEVVVTGVVVSILVSLFTYRVMGLNFAAEKKAWLKIFPIISYLFEVLVAIFEANIQMIALILSPVMEIKPIIVYFESPLRTKIAQVVMANTITITPGSVTLQLEDNKFVVHAIKESYLPSASVDGIKDSVFFHRLKQIEGGH